MRFFAIALVPGGNILAQLSDIKRRSRSTAGFPGQALPMEALSSRDHAPGQALPEGIYIGFFQLAERRRKKELIRIFEREGQDLFSGLPGRFRFGAERRIENRLYLAPLEGLPKDPMENTRRFARAAGLRELANTPILPGIGFFMGNDVTLSPADAFSFSNVEVLLLELHSPNARWESAAWRVLTRQARRRGSIGD